jgi:hypothetical protein
VQDLLGWIELSALGRFMRESGPWTYALVNLAHVLGIASLLGSILVLDLRLLGLFRHVPVGVLADAAVPVARAAFVLAVASGVGLISANATDYEGNPFLLVKFAAIGVGLGNAVLLGRSPAWRGARRGGSGRAGGALALRGGISLVAWLVAVAAGRLIGYW